MGRLSAFWAGAIKQWSSHLSDSDFSEYWSAQVASIMTFLGWNLCVQHIHVAANVIGLVRVPQIHMCILDGAKG